MQQSFVASEKKMFLCCVAEGTVPVFRPYLMLFHLWLNKTG
jgi:hypothetical protein